MIKGHGCRNELKRWENFGTIETLGCCFCGSGTHFGAHESLEANAGGHCPSCSSHSSATNRKFLFDVDMNLVTCRTHVRRSSTSLKTLFTEGDAYNSCSEASRYTAILPRCVIYRDAFMANNEARKRAFIFHHLHS
jgi:hypothetical protein